MKNVLVVGDIIIDKYTYGTAIGISAETPTVVASKIEEKRFVGGAALVCRHLFEMGNNVTLLTMTNYVDPSLDFHVINYFVDSWNPTVKHRYFVDGYKLLQIDSLCKGAHTANTEDELLEKFEAAIVRNNVSAVIICDNRHGVLNENIASHVLESCRMKGIKVFVDSQVSQKQSNHDIYSTTDFMFMNEKELESYKNNRKISWTNHEIAKSLGSNIILKRGENGCSFYSMFSSAQPFSIPGIKVDVVDTCGAGDAFLAKFVDVYESMSLFKCLEEANKYAALSCTVKGTDIPKEI